MNLASIIQAIATAVNAKMSLKISQQIAQISTSMPKGPGWISGTAAGHSVSQQRLNASFSKLQNATSAHSEARTSAQKSAEEWLQESLGPTGKDLAALAQTAAKYKAAMDLATAELERVTKEHYSIKASEVSESHLRRSEKMDDAISAAQEAHDRQKNRFSVASAELSHANANPGSLSPQEMAQLDAAVSAYEQELKNSADSLSGLRQEQDALRRAIDTRLLAMSGVDKSDLMRLDHAGRKTEKAIDVRSSIQGKHDAAREALLAESLFPTGKTDKQMLAMGQAVVQYKQDLDRASEAVKKAVAEQEQLRQAVEQQIHAITGVDPHALESANQDVASKTNAVASAKQAADSSRNALDQETANPTGMTPDQILKLKDDLSDYEYEVEMATKALQQSTAAQNALQQSVNAQVRATTAAMSRRKPLMNRIRQKWSSKIQRWLGPQRRQQIKGLVNRVGKYGNVFSPMQAKLNKSSARTAFRNARQAHKAAVAAHKTAPTAANMAAAQKAGSTVATAGQALKTASAVAGVAEAFEAVAVVSGPVGLVVAGVATAIKMAYDVIVQVLTYFSREAERGEQVIEKLRMTRAKFNGEISNAIRRFDYQSRQLEMRSGRHTQASASAVADSTMALREANQPRSEELERLANERTAAILDITAWLSKMESRMGIITGYISFMQSVPIGLLRLTGIVKAIENNTKPAVGDLGIDMMLKSMVANEANARNKRRDLPPIR